MLSVEVQFDGKAVFTSPAPLCLGGQAASKARRPKKQSFSFLPGRPIRWAASHEEEEMARERDRNAGRREGTKERESERAEQEREARQAQRPVRGRIWIAGTDPKAPLLAVSFASGETMINLIHVALPDRPAQTHAAPGLFVLTTPVGEK
jgi:hypothetical protein